MCQKNINCPDGNDWQKEKRGVVYINTNPGDATGSLINNIKEDGKLYVLTAYHALNGNEASWKFYFDIERISCENPDSNRPIVTNYPEVVGCTILSSWIYTDFALLELNYLPNNYEPYFNGWSVSTVPPTSSVGIHHPQGDYKKISINNDPVNTNTEDILLSDWPLPFIYAPPGHLWNSIFDTGTTESGSSGSPLFDQNHRIVGQLFGGGDHSCDNQEGDIWYGRLDKSWEGGGTPETRLKDWLDPDNTGIQQLGGLRLTEPDIDVKDGTVAIEDGGSYNFSVIDVGTPSDLLLTLENNGTHNLYIDTPLVFDGLDSPHFNILNQPSSMILPGENTTFTIRFLSSVVGMKTAYLHINNNDIGEVPYDITFQGEALPVSNYPSTGDGSFSNPYQIETIENLNWLSQNSSEWDKHYIQTADIDASSTNGGSGFSPIGNNTTQFIGSYNGQNYNIYGLYINRPATDYVALFGFTDSATLKNISLNPVNIIGDEHVGSLGGKVNNGTKIESCSAVGTINGNIVVGGLVGGIYHNSTLKFSSVNGEVSGELGVGGLVGWSSTAIDINSCYSHVNVRGDDKVGGLFGFIDISHVTNCYSRGDITLINGFYLKDAGAFGGYFNRSTVKMCYSTGSVYAGNSAPTTGGFIGTYGYSNIYNNNFCDIEASNQLFCRAATAKTTSQMISVSTFTNIAEEGLTIPWDFENNPNNDTANKDYWDLEFGTNGTYPFLTMRERQCTDGSIIYNSETNKFNFCEDGIWVEK